MNDVMLKMAQARRDDLLRAASRRWRETDHLIRATARRPRGTAATDTKTGKANGLR